MAPALLPHYLLFIVQWITILTNFDGLVLTFIAGQHGQSFLCAVFCIVTISSTLMHLSEIKHGLPGIKPFNTHSKLFLTMDRFTSYTIMLGGILSLLQYDWDNLIKLGKPFVMGLFFLTLAERLFVQPDNIIHLLGYFITHNMWHILAYRCLFIWYGHFMGLNMNHDAILSYGIYNK